jgi:hypothetical protein
MAKTAFPFTKSYYGYFSDKIYEIKSRHDHGQGIFRYGLIDTSDGFAISGTWYSEELLVVDE